MNIHRCSGKMFPWLMVLIVLIHLSCTYRENDFFHEGPLEGLKPIYMNETEARKIEVLSPRELNNPGKIYVYGSFLFINELYSGIHIINNSNPEKPVSLAFIKIIGNVDIAVKDDILYADNVGDLVAINVSNVENIKLVKRVEDVFPANDYPAQVGVYFECVDASKGKVVGWEKTIIENITCRR